jgi:basic amino acid/polyamine antiporter, APA family
MGSQPASRLARKIGLSDATVLGLGAMVGAGIFSAIGPAAGAAGQGLLVAILLAGLLAILNASSMVQLATLFPESGGAYAYGRRRLSPYWGFLAGWSFVVGKVASCTAMALTFGHYAYPEHPHLLAGAAVLLLTSVNYLGVKKTSLATKVILALVLLCLAGAVFAVLAGNEVRASNLGNPFGEGGILEAAGLMFFAFAGYARIATLGEEVLDPQRTIPRAVLLSLTITILLYLTVAVALLLTFSPSFIAGSPAPLADAVAAGSLGFLAPAVRAGAALASLGVLLSLLAGVSRTVFAMASNHDLPKALGAVHPYRKVPHRSEFAVGLLVAGLVAVSDLRLSIGFSSFAVLAYYSLAHASALTLKRQERKWHPVLPLLGFLFCLLVAFNLPGASVTGGLALLALGTLVYGLGRLTGRRP